MSTESKLSAEYNANNTLPQKCIDCIYWKHEVGKSQSIIGKCGKVYGWVRATALCKFFEKSNG